MILGSDTDANLKKKLNFFDPCNPPALILFGTVPNAFYISMEHIISSEEGDF